MIPIGTRCIVVGFIHYPEVVGKIFTVRDYCSDGFPTVEGPRWEYRGFEPHPVTEIGWAMPGKFLVPIGHDPDAETRTTDREVEA